MDPDLLLSRLSSSEDIAPFRKLVEPLLRYDLERGSDLVRTLRVYFACGGNASEAADRLFLHRNSMPYRLQRIEGLAGADLKNPRQGLILQLALLAVEGEERNEADADKHP